MRNMPFSATILGIRDEEMIVAVTRDYRVLTEYNNI